MLYAVVAWIAECLRDRTPHGRQPYMAPVTVLKPLCGAEPETYECLRSICDQSYPEFQVLFGVADPNDPVLPIVKRLQSEFPQRDIQWVASRKEHGASRKVSNLINIVGLASHDILVISDSDVLVGTDYLARVIDPLGAPDVGVVTCAYRGVPRTGLWAMLGAQFVNEWFMPSVQVAAMGGSRSFAFGATIALRREVLDQIGGFGRLANQLADDYRLGELTRDLGLRTVLSDVEVDVVVAEQTYGELIAHELRWLRTIRTVRPMAYRFFFVTFGIPVASIGVLLSSGNAYALTMFAITCIARFALHSSRRRAGSAISQFLLVPMRDTLSLALWVWSFTTRKVRWRGDIYRVDRDGSVLQS